MRHNAYVDRLSIVVAMEMAIGTCVCYDDLTVLIDFRREKNAMNYVEVNYIKMVFDAHLFHI